MKSKLFFLLLAILGLSFVCHMSGRLEDSSPQRTSSITRPTRTPVRRTSTQPTRTPTSTLTIKTIKHSNIRTGPGTNYPVLTQITNDQVIKPTGRNTDGSWLRISIDNTKGWIWTPLTTMDDPNPLPTVLPPPPSVQTEPSNTPQTITSTPQPPTPEPARSGTFLSGTCKDLIAQGKVPKGGWTPDNINYTPGRDRDKDGRACDN